MSKKRVAVLISGTGSNLQKLIEACQRSDYPAEIVLVLANRVDAGGLRLAETAGIPAKAREWVRRNQQVGFERWVQKELSAAKVDLICCAGFMRLLSGEFVNRFENRILNIHPALLPAFPGLHTHQRALDAGAKFSGCTVHLMREEMDTGPIVAQAATAILDNDTADTLAARILTLEHKIYPAALELLASGRINILGNRVCPIDPLDPMVPIYFLNPALTYSRKRLIEFPQFNDAEDLTLAPAEKQKMPRSLGLTLRAMRVMAGLSVDQMAHELSKNVGRFNPTEKGFSRTTVSNLELSQTGTSNWHLETYQNWSYVPTSCIDLIAHIGADLRDGNIEAARALANAVGALCNLIETNAVALRKKVVGAAFDPDLAADYNRFKDACEDGSAAKMKKGGQATSEEQQRKDLLMLLLAQQMVEMLLNAYKRPLRKIRAARPNNQTKKKG